MRRYYFLKVILLTVLLKSNNQVYKTWACLTADANCSSVMSSTKTVLAEGSSGRASADPIISTVIPCKKKKKIMKTQS